MKLYFIFIFSLPATHEFLQKISGPARIYYRLTRWLFGTNYNPFGESSNDEIHPVSKFMIDNFEIIRLFFTYLTLMIQMIFVISSIYMIQQYFSHTQNYSKVQTRLITILKEVKKIF